MKKIMVCFGTRPEAVKMCPVVKALARHTEAFETVVCVTGQHREMLRQVLDAFGVMPQYDLAIMEPRQTLFTITGKILAAIEPVLERERPDLMLVHGDATTSFSCALAAFYKQIPVGHVEAGLRTHNLYSPYPEEFNRQAVGILARYHFAPTETARDNLLREGKNPAHIFVTGNTGIDALKTTVRDDYRSELLDWAAGSRLVLLTAHRRENLGDGMRRMFRAIARVVAEREDVKLVYPVHLNPRVRPMAEEYLHHERIRLIPPLEVPDFHNLMARAYLVLTDSGGIQEEAPAFGKPVLVLRDTTERPEGVAAGTLRLVGTGEREIYEEFLRLLDDRAAYERMAKAKNPYGDGRASERIVAQLLAAM